MRTVVHGLMIILASTYFGLIIYQASHADALTVVIDGAIMGVFIAIASMTKDNSI